MANHETDKETDVPINKLIRWLMILLPVGAAISLGIHFWKSERSLVSVLAGMKTAPILVACLLGTVPWWLRTAKLYIWTRFLGKSISIGNLLRVVLGTDLGRAVSPTVLGGGPLKVGLLMKNGLQSSRALTLSLWSTCEDTLYFLLAGGAGLLLIPRSSLDRIGKEMSGMQMSAGWMFGLPLLALIVLISWYYRKSIDRGLEHLDLYVAAKRKVRSFLRTSRRFFVLVHGGGKIRVVISLLLTFCQWTCYFLILYFVMQSFGIHIHPVTVVALQVLLYVSMLLVPTPGAAAGAEALFLIVFGALLPDAETGVITAGWRVLTFYFQVCAGLVLFIGVGLVQQWFAGARVN